MSRIKNDLETDCYSKIINFFKNRPVDNQSTEIWKNKSFIQLMKILERTNNKELVQNAIILILSLFEGLPPDLYTNQGINVDLLGKKEKKSVLKTLKSEFSDLV